MDGLRIDRNASDQSLIDSGLLPSPKGDQNVEDVARTAVYEEGEAPHTKAEAERIKENYLAMLRRLEYDQATQEVVPIANVIAAVADEFAKVRNRLLNLGSRVAQQAAVLRTPEEVKTLIDEEIVLTLNELTIDGYDRSKVQKQFGDSK